MSDTSSNKVNIKLGDMIEIIAPNDITTVSYTHLRAHETS